MSSADADEFRILLARASDGSLTSEEQHVLNEQLIQDPIAQEQYLDHLILEGLLEWEFQHSTNPVVLPKHNQDFGTSLPPGRRDHHAPRALTWLPWITVASIALFLGAGSWLWMGRHGNLPSMEDFPLVNAGFERELVITENSLFPVAWYGDEIAIVEEQSGVTPLKGQKMVRFVKSTSDPNHSCEIYQLVDLSQLPEKITNQQMAVEASAFFNMTNEQRAEGDYAFTVTVFAFSDVSIQQQPLSPLKLPQPLNYSGAQQIADLTTDSWQEVSTRLTLPSNTKYLIIQLAVSRLNDTEHDSEFPGQFADEATLKLVRI